MGLVRPRYDQRTSTKYRAKIKLKVRQALKPKQQPRVIKQEKAKCKNFRSAPEILNGGTSETGSLNNSDT